jgi:hypothetical protein
MPEIMRRLWRRWVIAVARRMPIESAGVCMAVSVLLLMTAVYLLPEAAGFADSSPGIGEALRATKSGARYLRVLEFAWVVGAGGAAWLFQARCLQICFPDFYDPYAED